MHTMILRFSLMFFTVVLSLFSQNLRAADGFSATGNVHGGVNDSNLSTGYTLGLKTPGYASQESHQAAIGQAGLSQSNRAHTYILGASHTRTDHSSIGPHGMQSESSDKVSYCCCFSAEKSESSQCCSGGSCCACDLNERYNCCGEHCNVGYGCSDGCLSCNCCGGNCEGGHLLGQCASCISHSGGDCLHATGQVCRAVGPHIVSIGRVLCHVIGCIASLIQND